MTMLGHARSPLLAGWVVAALAFGVANSIATVAQVAYIADQFDPGDGRKAFSYENVALNLGGGIAPLLSAVVLVSAPDAFPAVPAAFAVLSIALAVRMPPDRPSDRPAERPRDQQRPNGPGEAGGSAKVGRADRADRAGLGVFLAMNFLTMLAYTQFADVFPAYGSGTLGAEPVGVLFTVSCAAIVLLQLPLTRASARLGVATQVTAANVIAAAGALLLMDLRAGWPAICLAVCLVTVAEMVYGPLYQAIAVRAFDGHTTTALAVLTFVWGVAESLATLVGLSLVAAHHGHLSMLLGATAAAAVALAATGLHLTDRGRWLAGRALAAQ
jgi:MFS family permease